MLAFCRFLRRKEFLQEEKNEKTFFPLSASSVSGEESDGLVPWPGVCPRRVLAHSEDGLGSSEGPVDSWGCWPLREWTCGRAGHRSDECVVRVDCRRARTHPEPARRAACGRPGELAHGVGPDAL